MPLTPNCIKAEMIYTHYTQRVENVYHFTKAGPHSLADLEALRVVLVNWENTVARILRGTSMSLVLVELTSLHAVSAPFLSSSTGLPLNGTVTAGVNMSSILTVAVKHNTGLAGRNNRGRTYWLGLNAGQMFSSEAIFPSHATALTNAYNTLRTSAATAGFVFVVNSLYKGVTIVNGRRVATPRAAGVTTPITHSTVEVNIDTNRHRKLP